MNKISNYKRIVEALMKKRESINSETLYDNMLKKINIIEISPINETTIKIFEDYTKTELDDSTTELFINSIKSIVWLKFMVTSLDEFYQELYFIILLLK